MSMAVEQLRFLKLTVNFVEMPNQNQQIQELVEHNDELENYFRNTIIPQLFVDGDFKLRKYTPFAMRQFNLCESDVRKPINDIKDNFRFTSIIDNIQQGMKSNKILEKEIQNTGRSSAPAGISGNF